MRAPIAQRPRDQRGEPTGASQRREKKEKEKEEYSGEELREHHAGATKEQISNIWTPKSNDLELALQHFLEAANEYPFDNHLAQPDKDFHNLQKFLQEDKDNLLMAKFLVTVDVWVGETMWTDTKVERFLVWLAERKPTILKKHDDGEAPILLAMRRKRNGFIRAIINREELRSALEEEATATQSGSWLRAAIKHQSPFLNKLVELRKSDDLFTAVGVGDVENALHALVKIVGDEVSEAKLEKVVKALVSIRQKPC